MGIKLPEGTGIVDARIVKKNCNEMPEKNTFKCNTSLVFQPSESPSNKNSAVYQKAINQRHVARMPGYSNIEISVSFKCKRLKLRVMSYRCNHVDSESNEEIAVLGGPQIDDVLLFFG